MPGSVIVSGARTPIGKLSGALKGFSAIDLGGLAIAAALAGRAHRRPGRLRDHGPGDPGGSGQITARQAAVKGGVPMTVPALTVNKVCLSGLNAIALADQLMAGRVRHRGGRRHGVDDQRRRTCCPAPGPATATVTATITTR